MSIVLYKTDGDAPYFYAVKIGMPEETVEFGEGVTPTEAVMSFEETQYQSADFGCRGPSNRRLPELFDLDLDVFVEIIDASEEEEEEAEEAYEEEG
ncbi:MAG: hypothetical protein RBS05_12470 [Zoogloea oleivorans]|jgi:hypothetical protein|uniref:hypothetical protein n=1 Tax=Zoogloea oleivorans TaxID=1552750 RepID=UPI002A36CB9A|nr:hypothetical protein [Zoogloea oleivorans]MDY0036715.1 hypothetical protein [Zoogloea oleivorans]